MYVLKHMSWHQAALVKLSYGDPSGHLYLRHRRSHPSIHPSSSRRQQGPCQQPAPMLICRLLLHSGCQVRRAPYVYASL